ncbi:MAG: glycerophosphoryl diester phosphodiesterase, partial [Myxococcota bacterium]
MTARLGAIILTLILGVPAGATPIVIGARGAHQDAPENTMPSFELAIAQGAHSLEVDTYPT